MKFLQNILQSFDFHSFGDFVKSLFPALKYETLTILTVGMSYVGLLIDKIFGLTWVAFLGLLLIMAVELISGIWSSKIEGHDFESKKLSRFSFKGACYLILIAVPYVLSISFAKHDNALVSTVFNWLYMFFVIEIVFEVIISILENIGVIQGKGKTFWIKKLQAKLKSVL